MAVDVLEQPLVRESPIEEESELVRGLRAALFSLEVEGWKQGGYGEPGRPKCTVGALLYADGSRVLDEGVRALFAALPEPPPWWDEKDERFILLDDHLYNPDDVEAIEINRHDAVTWWNDEPMRTFEEVRSLYERAIEMERSRSAS